MDKTIYDLLHLPSRLFKYYRYNDRLNAKRFSGEVYLATPFDFNDPCDCQRDVVNNAAQREAEKGDGWVQRKLEELGYSKKDAMAIAKSLLKEDTCKYQVYKRQLEKVGILCLTSNYADTLMWGYYANNDGYCIEYDTNKIIQRLVIGYINQLDYASTRRLFQSGKYEQEPHKRVKSISDEQLSFIDKFDNITLTQITNTFLVEVTDANKVLNFVKNVFLKRFVGKNIDYSVGPDGDPSTLFFDKMDSRSYSKYYKKTKTWEHEAEFRIVVSLGGKFAVNLGEDCIKRVYLGCNMNSEKVMEIAYLMQKCNVKTELYKMRRLKNCGLQAVSIKEVFDTTKTNNEIEQILKDKCKFYW